MRLKTVEDHDSTFVLMSDEFNHGDWPFRYSIRLLYCEEWDRKWAEQGRYHVAIEVTSPTACSDQLKSVRSSYGVDSEEFNSWPDEARHLACADYGCKATLWQEQGNNRETLIRFARKELNLLHSFTFGFAMDRAQNAIGASGWDFIAGNPLGELRRS